MSVLVEEKESTTAQTRTKHDKGIWFQKISDCLHQQTRGSLYKILQACTSSTNPQQSPLFTSLSQSITIKLMNSELNTRIPIYWGSTTKGYLLI
jgi:hypothetical protein